MSYSKQVFSFCRKKTIVKITLKCLIVFHEHSWALAVWGASSCFPRYWIKDLCLLCLPRKGNSMASVLSRRLGKRSLLGARVLGPPGAAPPSEPQAELLEGAAPQPFVASKDASCQEQPKEVLKAPGTSGLQLVAFHPGQKVG